MRPTLASLLACGLLAVFAAGCGRQPAPAPKVVLRPPGPPPAYRPQPIGAPVEGKPWIAHLNPVDFDRDGLMDLLACEAQRNQVLWLRQSPRGTFTEQVLAEGIAAPVHVEAVDMNGDSRLDLLVSSMGVVFPNNEKIGSVIILENHGQERFTRHVIAQNIARVNDIRAGDFNGDGRLDLAVAQFGYTQGEIRWMENLGEWKFKSRLLLNLAGAINVLIADFDGNATLDIAALVSQQWEEVVLFRNSGTGTFTHHVVYGSTNEDYGSSGITLCDLNRDRRPDILYTNGDGFDYAQPGSRPWHGVQWLENLGGGKFAYHRIGDLGGAYSPVAVDVDGNGATDVVAVSGFNFWNDPASVSMMLFQNDGAMNFTPHVLAHTPTHLLCAAAADLDGTGTPVLVTGGFHAYPPFAQMSRITLWRSGQAGPKTVERPAAPDLKGAADELRRRIAAADATLAANPRSAAALAELAQLYHANGFLPQAEAAYRELLRSDATNPRWPHLLATLLAGFGRLDEAIPLLQQAATLAPDYLPARLKLGDSLMKAGRPDEAEAAYQAIVAREPAHPYALLGLARIDLARERLTAAREKLSRAAAADPRFFGAQSLLTSVFEQLGDDEAAAHARARANQAGRFKEAPDPWADALLDRCFDLYRLQVAAATAKSTGEPRAALPLLQRAAALAPQDATTLRQLGTLRLELRDLAGAREPLEQAVALDPREAAGWVTLASWHLASGNAGGARQALETGLPQVADPGPIHAELGALLLRSRQVAEGITHLQEAMRRSPEKPEIARDLVGALFEAGRPAEAATTLRHSLSLYQEYAPLLVQATRLGIMEKDPAAAAAFLRRAEKAGASPGELTRLAADYRRQFGMSPD